MKISDKFMIKASIQVASNTSNSIVGPYTFIKEQIIAISLVCKFYP